MFQEHRSWLQLQIVLLICRFTPTCPEVTRILSLGMDKQLSLMMRMKLRIHYLMCSFCQRYMKQLKYIREVSREFPDKIGEVSDASLSADANKSRAAAITEFTATSRSIASAVITDRCKDRAPRATNEQTL
jgi:hypothetical protein